MEAHSTAGTSHSARVAMAAFVVAVCSAWGSGCTRNEPDDPVEVAASAVAKPGDLAADAVVAIVDSQDVADVRAWAAGGAVPADKTLQARLGTCADEPFAQQPAFARCSGVMLDHDLLLTAGHCFDDRQTCEGSAFVFGYRASTQRAGSGLHVARCSSVVVRALSDASDFTRLDFAVVRLKGVPANSGGVVTRVSPLRTGEALSVLGFPTGLPRATDANARMIDARGGADFFMLDAATRVGSSGSPVLDAQQRLVGIMARGERDFTLDRTRGCLRARSDRPAGGEAATYVAPALRALCAVDPSLAACRTFTAH